MFDFYCIYELHVKNEFFKNYQIPLSISYKDLIKYFHNAAGPAYIEFNIIENEDKSMIINNKLGTKELLNLKDCHIGLPKHKEFFFNGIYLGSNLNDFSEKEIERLLNDKLLL